jgi:hypothetical protein
MREKAPPVFLDYDQAELDAAYDQAAYAPNREQFDVFAELTDRDFLRCVWRVGPAKGALFGELPGPALETEPWRVAGR